MDEPRVVITPTELAERSEEILSPAPASKPRIPWWAIVIAWALAFVFPLLAVFSVLVRVSLAVALLRKEGGRFGHAAIRRGEPNRALSGRLDRMVR